MNSNTPLRIFGMAALGVSVWGYGKYMEDMGSLKENERLCSRISYLVDERRQQDITLDESRFLHQIMNPMDWYGHD